MTISINNDANNAQITNAAQGKKTSPASDNNNTVSIDSKQGNASDQITLTNSGKLIQQLEQQLQDIPVVDLEKVTQIRENINSGNHDISSARIAQKFTQYENLLSSVG